MVRCNSTRYRDGCLSRRCRRSPDISQSKGSARFLPVSEGGRGSSMWCCGRLELGLMLWRLLLQLHVISIRHAVMLADELLLLSTECSKQVGHPLFLIMFRWHRLRLFTSRSKRRRLWVFPRTCYCLPVSVPWLL